MKIALDDPINETPTNALPRSDAPGRLVAFDALRGVAALAVLLHHLHLPGAIFGAGYFAVDLFFMLSGYVLAQTYEPALANGIKPSTFMRVRIERLYPMLLLGGLLGVALFPTFQVDGVLIPQNLDWPIALISQFLLIPYLASPSAFVFNNVQWSIVYELIANALHSSALRLLTNLVLVLIVIGSLVVLIAAAPRFGSLSFGIAVNTFVLGFARVGFGYFIGVLLQRTEARWQRFVPAIPTWRLIGLLLIILGMPLQNVPPITLQVVSLVTLLALVLLVMLGSKARGSDELSAELGMMSYPLYAIQSPLLALVVWWLAGNHFGIGLSTPGALPIGAVLICLLAWLVGHKIEQPLIKWRSRGARQLAIRAARRQAAPVAPKR
jgi:peptidoglycan/LPS O-acetylase OafA/YrhL